MERKPKWSADDLAALETLVKRHGVAAVTRKALQVLVAKKKPGSPARPAADAQAVWLAIEVRRQRLVRAGFKGAVSKAAQELAAELKVRNPDSYQPWNTLKRIRDQEEGRLVRNGDVELAQRAATFLLDHGLAGALPGRARKVGKDWIFD
jgi:hypothetical protein